jgi:hypothetical protein
MHVDPLRARVAVLALAGGVRRPHAAGGARHRAAVHARIDAPQVVHHDGLSDFPCAHQRAQPLLDEHLAAHHPRLEDRAGEGRQVDRARDRAHRELQVGVLIHRAVRPLRDVLLDIEDGGQAGHAEVAHPPVGVPVPLEDVGEVVGVREEHHVAGLHERGREGAVEVGEVRAHEHRGELVGQAGAAVEELAALRVPAHVEVSDLDRVALRLVEVERDQPGLLAAGLDLGGVVRAGPRLAGPLHQRNDVFELVTAALVLVEIRAAGQRRRELARVEVRLDRCDLGHGPTASRSSTCRRRPATAGARWRWHAARR